MATFVVDAKLPGKSRPIFSDWSIPLPPEIDPSGGRLTLRALIARIVREEVTAFETRQEKARLTRVLSATQIEVAADRGKVDMGGRTLRQGVDAEQAISTALQAFEDGLYLVWIDDLPAKSLDEEVYVGPDTHVTFIRLVALAGA